MVNYEQFYLISQGLCIEEDSERSKWRQEGSGQVVNFLVQNTWLRWEAQYFPKAEESHGKM